MPQPVTSFHSSDTLTRKCHWSQVQHCQGQREDQSPCWGTSSSGRDHHHLLNDLFEVYKVASDKCFIAYIRKKRDEYVDLTAFSMEPHTLTLQASNYTTSPVSVEAEEWERPPQEEEQIIALEAQVKQLEANVPSFTSNASLPGSPRIPKSPGGHACNIKPPWKTMTLGSGEPQKHRFGFYHSSLPYSTCSWLDTLPWWCTWQWWCNQLLHLLRLMHLPASLWILPQLATLFYVFMTLHILPANDPEQCTDTR